MKEIIITEKQAYLNANYPFERIPDLSDKQLCIHCYNVFTVGDFKLISHQDFEFICCPHAPDCNGTVIDWIDPDDFESDL